MRVKSTFLTSPTFYPFVVDLAVPGKKKGKKGKSKGRKSKGGRKSRATSRGPMLPDPIGPLSGAKVKEITGFFKVSVQRFRTKRKVPLSH